MSSPPRFETYVEEGTIYVGSPDGPLPVGDLEKTLRLVGGPSWTISYSEAVLDRHPGLDTGDAGLTVDVVDTIHAMTHSRRFVETLAAQPTDPLGAAGSDSQELPPPTVGGSAERGDQAVEMSPRLGLFVGKLLETLESGLD